MRLFEANFGISVGLPTTVHNDQQHFGMADAVVFRLVFAGILMCMLYLHSATCLPTSELLKRFSKEELEAKMKIIKDAYEKILDNRMQELNAFYQLHGRPRFGKRSFRGAEGRIILPDIDEEDDFVYRVV
ncbi:hypothetical protein T265_08526 [Opisthorchis viverrini]|uniref:Uncharacterized protein n=1 Tax=Opisthorchis viverrini TaxID=6198 RepID=A0A074ZD96_OPIVI|nr:hypothetical protein T265_08526 [Opisthorchis viverrini]KER23627.1 hypothetical protein T265_08526 [Opisthorchis viverrini]